MSDQAAFIRAICTDPAEDTHRLVYADWLDEHDQSARAEFIRVGVELATMPPEPRKLFVADGAGTMMEGLGVGLVHKGDGYYSASSQERGLSTEIFAPGERVDIYADVANGKKDGPRWMRGLKYVRHVTGKRELVIFRKDDQSGPWVGRKLQGRHAELLATHEREWRGWVLHCKRCGGRGKSLDPKYSFFPTDDPCPQCKGVGSHVAPTWTRGFISGIECTLETFETAAKAGLFRMQPVTSVRLSDVNIHRTDFPADRPYTWSGVRPALLPALRTGPLTWWHPTEEACRLYLSEQFVAYGHRLAGLPALSPQVTA